MRLSPTDLSPDGVRVCIDWDKFIVGTSIFIPCVNTKMAFRHVLDASSIDRSSLTKRVCIEKGKYGLRVWRIK
jgi:hypothetical protein